MTDNPFVSIETKLLRLEKHLVEMREALTLFTPPPPAEDDFLILKDAAEFLGVANQTMYQNVRRIPHYKRFGKLYFKRSDLMKYLEDGVANQ